MNRYGSLEDAWTEPVHGDSERSKAQLQVLLFQGDVPHGQ